MSFSIATLFYVVTLCCFTLLHYSTFMLYIVVLRNVTLQYVMKCYVELHNVML